MDRWIDGWIDIQTHTHMHIYICILYILHAHTHTYIYTDKNEVHLVLLVAQFLHILLSPCQNSHDEFMNTADPNGQLQCHGWSFQPHDWKMIHVHVIYHDLPVRNGDVHRYVQKIQGENVQQNVKHHPGLPSARLPGPGSGRRPSPCWQHCFRRLGAVA